MSLAAEVVVGLEVHVQLKTATKLFCGCATQFAAPPNSLTCPICSGMPGALPVLNRRAVELAIRAGLGLNCAIAEQARWDRKHYFYPDLPKGYQISQLDWPLCLGGYLDIPGTSETGGEHRVRLQRAHLEEDAGKSVHDHQQGRPVSLIDLNRAGTPLLEIVTEPDLRGGDETRRFLAELRLILLALEVSDCNMQEGSLRVDANVNLRIPQSAGPVETPIVELKNLNSFRAIQRAIDHEAARLWSQWQQDGVVRQTGNKQTRGWDDERGESYALRDKEELDDYRYFPDPDLPELRIDPDWVDALRRSLVRLPAEVRQALLQTHGLSQYDAEVLVAQGSIMIDYFDRAVRGGGKPKQVANWLLGDILAFLREQRTEIGDYSLAPERLGQLLTWIDEGRLTLALGRDWLRGFHANRMTWDDLLGFLLTEPIDDEALGRACADLIAAAPEAVAAFRSGKEAALGPLIGQLRRQFSQVEPRVLRERLMDLIQGGGDGWDGSQP